MVRKKVRPSAILNPHRGIHGRTINRIFISMFKSCGLYKREDVMQVEVRGGDVSVHDKRRDMQALSFGVRVEPASVVGPFFIFGGRARDEGASQSLPRGAKDFPSFFHTLWKRARFSKAFGYFSATLFALVFFGVVFFLLIHILYSTGFYE